MNRYIRNLIGCGLVFLSVLAGCKKDDTVDTTVSAVKTLFTPDDNVYVKLEPATTATVTFEWDQARAADGGLVLYEIAFDKAGGDFSQPVYKIASDGNGLYNKATISHKLLNKIASLAGIGSLETGMLEWTVFASKGVNEVQSSETREIEVERPAGFAEIPATVYLTGSATEAGDNLAGAIALKPGSTGGEFEIYTRLQPGTYQFADRNTGSPKTYYIDGQFIKENGSSTVTVADTGIYRIHLDFNNAAVQVTRIKELGLWFCADNAIRFMLDYAGNGTWQLKNTTINFADVPWGKDERYKFRLLVNDGSSDSYEWWGSSNADNQRPTDSSPASYFFLNPIANSDQWNYAFKFRTEVDTKNCDINVYFSPDKTDYTHEVIIL